jgi:mono/diheme cytochrome c family protein
MGDCGSCHRGNSSAGRKNIAHAGLRGGRFVRFAVDKKVAEESRRLLEQLACRRCHVSGGRGNRLAVSLDMAAGQKSPAELAVALRHPVPVMPDFRLTDVQLDLLLNAVYAGAEGRPGGAGEPVKVHFSVVGQEKQDIFSQKCGGCHRLLSERLGALGSGTVAPNLSGLLTQFYPRTFKNGAVWTMAGLELWLRNPRTVTPWARMRPVKLNGAELRELGALFQVSQP